MNLKKRKILIAFLFIALLTALVLSFALVGNASGDYEKTEYGDIPSEYADASEYPFAVFSDSVFLGAYSTWYDATYVAQNAVGSSSYQADEAEILLRRDFVSESGDNGATINKATNLILDLGGHTFTYCDLGINLSGSYGSAPYRTNIVVMNGTLLNSCGNGFVRIGHSKNSTAKEFSLDFRGVSFGFASGADIGNMLVDISSTTSGAGSITAIEYNDCTFNLRDNVPSAVTESKKTDIFFAYDSTKNANLNITVNGGEILTNNLKLFNFLNGDSNDSLTFDKGSDGYTALITPSTNAYTNGLQYTASFNTPVGDMYFIEMQDDGVNSVCVLDKVDFDYGSVEIATNNKHLSAVDYPFAVFADNEFKGAYGMWNEALNRATELAKSSNDANKTVHIAQRRDFASAKGTGYTSAKCKIEVDLRGFTLSCTDKYLVDIYVNYEDSTGLGYSSSLKIKNGTLKAQRANAPMIAIGHKGTNASYETKHFFMEFSNVTFAVGADGSTFLMEWTGNPHIGDGVNLDYKFDSCTFDLRGAKAGSVFFNMQNTFNKSSAAFYGGRIISDNLSAVSFCNVNSADICYFEAVDGEYITLIQPSQASNPEAIFKTQSGSALSFAFKADDGIYSEYVLAEPIVTDYGEIPYVYKSAEEYPFIVFGSDGRVIGAFNSFLDKTEPYSDNGAVDCAKRYLSENTYNGSSYGESQLSAVIILRRDYKFADNESYNNLAQVQGVLIIDLMGHTLEASDKKIMLPSSIKPWTSSGDESIFPTEFYFKNGNINVVNSALINFNSWRGSADLDVSGKEFIYRFDNVCFTVLGSTKNIIATASTSSTPDATGYPEVIFNDCTFDITNAVQGATLFNLGNGLTNISVTVAGGRIIGEDKSFEMYSKKDNTTSKLTFTRGTDGKYTELALPLGVPAPIAEYYGFKFVKSYDSGDNTVYALAPVAAMGIEFSPLASLTLDSNLIFNLYIPKDDRIATVKLNGEDYTDKLGEAVNGYYVIPKELSANEGAMTLKLVVTLDIGGTLINGTFTFSTVKYATKVLQMETSDKEKTLIKDMLSYIRSAYVYLNGATESTAEIQSIDTVLAGYKTEFIRVEGAESSDKDDIIAGVTFVLDSTPKIRFYFHRNSNTEAYSFTVGNTPIEPEEITFDIESTEAQYLNYPYADISLYAYKMIEDITVFADGKTAIFHINSYYDSMDISNPELVDVVSGFYSYCRSASEYRNYVKDETMPSYDITSLSINGVSLGKFSFAYDYGSNANISAECPNLNRYLKKIHDKTGLQLQNAVKLSELDSSSEYRFIVRYVEDAGAGGFRAFVDGGDFIVECSYWNAFDGAFSKFLDEYALLRTGKIDFPDGFLYEKNVSVVKYSDFGARGDGVTNDIDAIIATHEFANLCGQKVMADDGASYYIGNTNKGTQSNPYIVGATVKTNTDFGNATFIIDDTCDGAYLCRDGYIFSIVSDVAEESITPGEIIGLNGGTMPSLNAYAESIPWMKSKIPAGGAMLLLRNNDKKDYIRFGGNVSAGSGRAEVILVDSDGNISEDTPLTFDFDSFTSITIYSIDDTPITVEGGNFVNICCKVGPETDYKNVYNSFKRGIRVQRSNVTVKNLDHKMSGEPAQAQSSSVDTFSQSYPYYGFICSYYNNNLTLENCDLTGHRVYREDKRDKSGAITDMGTYDLIVQYSIGAVFKNVTQSEVPIHDHAFWGIMASNYSRNMRFEGCELSRFDAHCGFWNADLIDCSFGQSINVIGGGQLNIINTKRYVGNAFITLRGDYGATFNGDVYIKDCEFFALVTYNSANGGVYNPDKHNSDATVFRATVTNGKYAEGTAYEQNYYTWDFGYDCYLPKNVLIDNFVSFAKNTYVFNGIFDEHFIKQSENDRVYIPTESITFRNMEKELPTCKESTCTVLNEIKRITE